MLTLRFRKAQKGQGLVEYATIVSLVALASIVILSVLGLAVSRNYAVVASVFGGKKNTTGSVTGLTNTISIETSSQQVECHTATASSHACTAVLPAGFCGTNGATYMYFQLYASPDIQQQDLALSVNNVYIPSTTSGSAASVFVTAKIATTSDAANCSQGIVVTGKKAIAIVPVQKVIPDN